MKYDGTNLKAVLEAHERWLFGPGEPDDNDRADFSGCVLWGVSLAGAHLYGADFRGANLDGCNMYCSILDGCDFEGATHFTGAYIAGAFFNHAKHVPWYPLACPSHGAFTAWKKAIHLGPDGKTGEWAVLRLLIPEDAKRSSGSPWACRADKAIVQAIEQEDGTPLPKGEYAVSIWNRGFAYRVGDTVHASGWSDNRWDEHTPGIHFYINRDEAVRHASLYNPKTGRMEWYD